MNVPKTIFCDIDGTIFKHTGDIIKNYISSSEILPNVIETFKSWDKNNLLQVEKNQLEDILKSN